MSIARNLSDKLINGYPPFNSVAVVLKRKNIRLLRTNPYSSKENDYLSRTDIADYHAGRLRKKEVEELLKSGKRYNHNQIVEAHAFRINENIKVVNLKAIIIHI